MTDPKLASSSNRIDIALLFLAGISLLFVLGAGERFLPEYGLRFHLDRASVVRAAEDSLRARGFTIPVAGMSVQEFPSTNLLHNLGTVETYSSAGLNRSVGWKLTSQLDSSEAADTSHRYPLACEITIDGSLVSFEYSSGASRRTHVALLPPPNPIGIASAQQLALSRFFWLERFLHSAFSYAFWIPMLIAVVVLIQSFGRGRFGMKNGLKIGLTIATVNIFSRLLVPRLSEGPPLKVAFALGLANFVLFAATYGLGESLMSRVWPEKLKTFQLLLAGKLFDRKFGRAAARGVLMGCVAFAVTILLRGILPATIEPEGSWSRGMLLENLGISIEYDQSFLRMIDGILLVAFFGTIFPFVLVLPMIRKFVTRPWVGIVGALIAYSGFLFLDVSAFSNTLFGLSLSITLSIGAVFTLAFLLFDLVTVFFGHVALIVLYQCSVLLPHGEGLWYANGISLAVVGLFVFIATLLISWKGRVYSVPESAATPPRSTAVGASRILAYALTYRDWGSLSPQKRIVYASGAVSLLGGSYLLLSQLLALSTSGAFLESSQLILAALLIFFGLFCELVIAMQKIELDRVRYSEELRTAHEMQLGLMPKQDPVFPGFDVSGLCRPAEEVGGDYFDYLWMNEEKTKLGIAIADVSGKAMKAAITAVMTSGMIYREIGGNQSPKEIMKKINKPMLLKTQKTTFVAMSIAVIDAKAKRLTISNAGQTHPLLKRGVETSFLKVEGTHYPLGILEDVEYQELTVPLQNGDLIVFYTDGISEATDANNEQFGLERLDQRIQRLTNETAKEAIQAIVGEAEKFAGSAKQHDDMTVVVVKVS